MTEYKPGKAEDVIGSAISVPMNLILGVADLLISKGVISQQETASLLRWAGRHGGPSPCRQTTKGETA